MAEKLERRSFLDKLLGKKAATEIDEAMAKMQEALDKSGVDRKEYDAKKVKGVLEDAVTGINEALSPLSDNIPEDLAPKILALVMGALADMPEPEMEAPEVETMEDDEEAMPEQLMALSKQVEALAIESTQATKDMREIIPHFVTMAKAVESLAPLVEKSQRVEGLEARIKELEGKLAMRPRIASQVKETIIENEQLKKEVEKGAKGVKIELGLPVKE